MSVKSLGVDIVVGETTRKQVNDFVWQELDRVRVKGKEQAGALFSSLSPTAQVNDATSTELKTWVSFVKECRA